MIKRICIMTALTAGLAVSDESLAATIYRCVRADGVPVFLEGPLSKSETRECKLVSNFKNLSGWENFANFGDDENRKYWSYRFFDEKRPANKIWVQVYYVNPDPIVSTVFLFEIKCSTKQLSTLQSSTYFTEEKNNLLSTNPTSLRYAIPGTTDEEILKIACMNPSK